MGQEHNKRVNYPPHERWNFLTPQRQPIPRTYSALRSSIQAFLENASLDEKNELEAGRNKLQGLIKSVRQASSEDHGCSEPDLKNRPVRQRFKDGYKAFSETAYHYSQYLDFMVEVAPEYVSLVWGAVKIILLVQVNHEELKDKICNNLENIVGKFEIIDHLPDYIPRRNLVIALADAYAYFSTYLAEAVKYYSKNRAKKAWNDFAKPWKIRFQPLISQIDEKFTRIKDIAQLHGLVTSHLNTVLSHANLAINKENKTDLKEILSYMKDRRNQEQGIRFLSGEDIDALGNMVRQCIAERLEEPFFKTTDTETQHMHQRKQGPIKDSLDEISSELFPELHELNGEKICEFIEVDSDPEAQAQRQLHHSILRTEKLINWVEATSSQLLWIDGNNVLHRSNFVASFAVPLMIDGESSYGSILLLRHFCGEIGSNRKNSCKALIQSLLFQLLKQRPAFYQLKKSELLRERTKSIHQLWDLLIDCIRSVRSECTFIIIDSIDNLYPETENCNIESQNFSVVEKLKELVTEEGVLIKILLTARLAEIDDPAATKRMALVRTTPHRRSTAVYNQDTVVAPFKLLQMQEGKCKEVLFHEIVGLYLPGSTIYCTENRQLRAFLVQELEPPQPRSFGTFTPLAMRVLFIDNDGASFVKRVRNLTVPQFSGFKSIKDLQFVPAGYLEDEAQTREMLRLRGEKFWRLCMGIHFKKAGPTRSDRVIIDQSGTSTKSDDVEIRLPDRSVSDIKPLTFILCTPFLNAFLLDELRWSSVVVDEVTDMCYLKNALDHVVLDEETKNVLRSSVERHFAHRSRDAGKVIIRGKMQGLIVLLHGAPGVGKTLTIECLANHTERAILYLDSSQLGTEPETIKQRLVEYLRYAERWGVIIQLDNAVDFLEAKTTDGDRERNILKALFFRELERFSGVIFLTTTRVSGIDKRVKGLFSLAFSLPDLTREDLIEIWKTNIRLIQPKAEEILLWLFDLESCRETTTTLLRLGARGMKNLIQAAVALAESEDDILRYKHVEIAATMQANFDESLRILKDLRRVEAHTRLTD